MKNVFFKDLNLSEEVQKAIADMGFEEATPIQSQTIPHFLKGVDLIGQAQTGTGKTCAFGIPSIEMLDTNCDKIQVLILSPTRELAIQISEELRNVSKYKEGVRILPIYGGQPIDRQISALKKHPQIIIGTPGRIMDHMRRRTLKLANLKRIILDEADEMLNMGFREDIDIILSKVPKEKQTILFSATMPKAILDLSSKYLKEPLHIKAAHKQMTAPAIEQFYLETSHSTKLEILSRLVDANNIGLSLVFCNTKRQVDELTSSLQTRGYSSEALHGDMKQDQRNRVMSKFKKGLVDILIATDVAARGIDVNNVEAVFNYDLPNDEEYYIHRIGRTGRAGKTGKSYTFVVGREIHKLKEIQRYTKSKIRLIKPPTMTDVEEKRIELIMNSVKETLSKGSFAKYVTHIENLLEESNSQDIDSNYITTHEIAAAMLKTILDQNSDQNSDQDVKTGNIIKKDIVSKDDMVRLFINIGRNCKIQPNHIVESIASCTSLPGKLIGAIDIYDKFTFVEVPKKYSSEVMEAMKNNTLKGKKIIVQKSRKKQAVKKSRNG